MAEEFIFIADLSNFLYPHNPYRGQLKPEYVIFNAKLQEFSQRINYICSLQTNGKISPEDAYNQIQILWEQLQKSRQDLD
jgi:hypothetical protein